MWRLAPLLLTACVVMAPAELRPRWRTSGADTLDRGCLSARAFVRKTGKDGFGVAVQLKSRGDCSVELGRAELVFPDGARAVGHAGLHRRALLGHSLIYEWMPIAFDNNAAWNAERNEAVLEISVAVGDARETWKIPVVQAL